MGPTLNFDLQIELSVFFDYVRDACRVASLVVVPSYHLDQFAVADAHQRVRHEAHWVTLAGGGRGAVREVADALLEARGRLDAAVDELLREHVGRGENLQ